MHIRRAHHLFPIRPYLSLLVEALEDSDSTVREVARTSVVELFTGPGVSDAARADLKKELTKKGVRKGIVDGVLTKVLAGGAAHASEGSENGDAGSVSGKKEYIPPSLMLQGRKPTVGSDRAQSSMLRSSSQSVKDTSRPASRAAPAAPASPPPTSATDDSSDVHAVYVTPIILCRSCKLELTYLLGCIKPRSGA